MEDRTTSGVEVLPPAPRDERGRPIEGVVFARLAPYVDHRGSLTEVVNFDHPFWVDDVVYAYRFTIEPGRIKGDDVLPILQPFSLARVNDCAESVAFVAAHEHDEGAWLEAIAELWKIGDAAFA